jgi:nucleoside phosphorylase
MPPSPAPSSGSTFDSGRDDVTIGIMTALIAERSAVSRLLMHAETVRVEEDPNSYEVGYLASTESARPHRVALVMLPQDNTRNAAATCTDLLRTFLGIRCVIMVGVAGGVPSITQPDRHVRLGDVIVADGIVDFGHVRQVDGQEELRRPVDGICVDILRGVAELRRREFEVPARGRGWQPDLPRGQSMAVYARPPAESDRLVIGGRQIAHPDPAVTGHRPGRPKVHYGLVGSGDVLMRDELRRDELARQYRIMAMEMEGAGVAASARLRGVQWFMIRGIVDYCENEGKSDRWHAYSAMMAAAYTRSLLGACRPFPAWPTAPRSGVLALLSGPDRDDIVRIVDQVSDLDPHELWHASAGDLAIPPPELLRTVGEVFDYLLELNAVDGLPPAIALLEEVSQRADEPIATDLRQRAERMALRLHAAEALQRRRQANEKPGAQPGAKPCLIVRIEPDGIDADLCVADYWIQRRSGPWRPEPGDESVEASFSTLESVLERFIRRAERAWRGSSDQVTIEFLLPTGLLNTAVEWWRTDLDTPVPSFLFASYDVVVRNLDRVRALHTHRMWQMRWSALWQAGAVGAMPRADPAGQDLAQWDAKLRYHADLGLVVLSTSPDDRLGRLELDVALRAGVPVILWDRRGPADDAAVTAVGSLTAAGPAQMLGKLRRLRMEAAMAEPRLADNHPGRHLAVLWDDPRRLIGFGEAEQ